MTISEIKTQLSIIEVLAHYHIAVNRNQQIRCPFHEDKTPSMQVYTKTNTVFCFSSNCNCHGKPLDVIDFIEKQEQLTTHEAINKAKTMIGTSQISKPSITEVLAKENTPKSPILQQLQKTFLASIYMSKTARAYLEQRNLDLQLLKGFMGYNSGQFHHSGRFKAGEEQKQQQLIQDCIQIGMLKQLQRTNTQTGAPVSYQVFAKDCIIFFLKDHNGIPVGLYGRSIKTKTNAKHFYLPNRQGLYPNYPHPNTTHLILTESIIDCATLQQINLPKGYQLLALYGSNGLTNEHKAAINQLKDLQEIIFCLDADQAGRQATKKYAKQLQKSQSIQVSQINLPSKDVNELAQGHGLNVFEQLLQERTLVTESLVKEHPEKREVTHQQSVTNHQSQLNHINTLIEQSGIIGEEQSRLLLFIIASSYKSKKPLHAIVQGSSGSGKTHLISKIAELMPKEDLLKFTRITESALYNFGEDKLVGKLLVIEDLDGLKEEALLAFRELVSNHQVSSGVSIKDKKGNIKATTKLVRGIFSSMSATTKGEIYEDNMNRSFVIGVDESKAQSERIIAYQNKRYAGKISQEREQKAKEELRHIIRNLQPLEVINPYATRLQLPPGVQKRRRLNDMFQSIIKQITWINQAHRKQQHGKLLSEIQDLQQAVTILFESIFLKIDELEGNQRTFYAQLQASFGSGEFTRFQAMQVSGLKKTQLQYHLNKLVELEYLRQYGHSNKGYRYRIGYNDNMKKVRQDIKAYFNQQLEKL